jgi:Flp pilus assembly protein TadD
MKLIFALLFFNMIFSCADAPQNNIGHNKRSTFIKRLKKKNDVEANIQSIIELLYKEKYIEVINTVDNELATRKDSISWLYYCRGIASYKLNDNSNAKQAFILSLQNNLPDDRIYGWLGDVYQRLSEPDSAVKYYNIGINKIGQDPYILNNLGISYMAKNECKKAIVIFQDLINKGSSTKPDSLYMHYCINLTQAYYTMKDYKNAFVLVQKYKKLYPNEYSFYNLEAQVYVRQGRFTEARNSWEKSLQLKPNDNSAEENLNKFDLIKAYHSEHKSTP